MIYSNFGPILHR